MKKIVYKIFFLVASLLVSCNEDPDIVDSIDGGYNRAIELSADVAQTKGAELKSESFNSFYLYTYYGDGSLYFKDAVTRDTEDASCSFDSANSYTWPDDTDLTPLSFYGYYPYANLELQTSEDGDVYVEYESSPEVENQDDFVVTHLSSDAVSSVGLEFSHALSKINFTLELNNDEVNVRNVKLYYSYNMLATQADYFLKSGVWSDLSGRVYSSDCQLTAYDCQTVDSKHTYSESLFVIPQAISSSEYLSVWVEYDIYNGNDLNYTVQTGDLALVSVESLGNTLVDEWQSGYEYTYDLSIDTDNEISFSLSVDSRDDLIAQGNIDLQYISNYYDVEDRIETLWSDGVKDLVIAGEYSSGILGYGSVSCPFISGFGDEYISPTYQLAGDGDTATHVYNSETGEYTYASDGEVAEYVKIDRSYVYGNGGDMSLFSVDFRLMTELPSFEVMHGGSIDATGDPTIDIDGSDPAFPKYIFQYAERLGEVILPENVIAIGDFAFQGCVKLESINMFGAKHVEQCSFQGCESLKTVITTGTDGTLTRVHNNGFDGCTSLTSINLGNIREIDDYGFVNCANLGVVNLSKVTNVGVNAFDGCTNLDIPAGTDIPNLTEISNYAFAKCATLGTNTDIVINKAVTIGDYAFNGCSKLHLGNDSSEYDISGIETIGRYAFQECVEIYNIDISNVISVGEYAFYACENLTLANNQTFANLIHIYGSAFHNCPVLCSEAPITINAPQIETLGAMAFNNCANFDFAGEAPQIFSKLTSAESRIFGDCKTLNNPLEFPNATSIGDSSFSGCILLPSVTIDPAKLKSIGVNAFYNCASISELEIDPTIIDYIGDSAFYSVDKLKINNDATLEFSNLDKVSEDLFYGCSSLNNALEFSDKLTSIGSSAFAASGITSVTGLDNVVYLGEKVFRSCSALAGELSLPSLPSLTMWSVFSGCSNLTSVKFGSISGSLGAGSTFQDCVKLISVTGLDDVTQIPSYCFSGCMSLPSLSLPSAQIIDNTAFSGCTGLTSLSINSLTGSLDSSLLSDCKESLISLEIDGITAMSYGAFSGFSKLETISLNGLSSYESYCLFYDCVSLKELSLPNFNVHLDFSRLFQVPTGGTTTASSYQLATLDLPNVPTIANASDYLAGMPNLTTLKLPKLESCGYGAFEGLTELTYLDLSCATLNMLESNSTVIFGAIPTDPTATPIAPADNQCTLVLNMKYKTEDTSETPAYTFVAPNADNTYTGVEWMNIVWANVEFVE